MRIENFSEVDNLEQDFKMWISWDYIISLIIITILSLIIFGSFSDSFKYEFAMIIPAVMSAGVFWIIGFVGTKLKRAFFIIVLKTYLRIIWYTSNKTKL